MFDLCGSQSEKPLTAESAVRRVGVGENITSAANSEAGVKNQPA